MKRMIFTPPRPCFQSVQGTIGKLAEELREVNTVQHGFIENSGIIQTIESFFHAYNTIAIVHGSFMTGSLLPASDLDVLLVSEPGNVESVIGMLRDFSISMNALITNEVVIPGNLVRMKITDEAGNMIQLDFMCVWNICEQQPIHSIYTYTQRTKLRYVEACPPVPIRAHVVCSPYVPRHVNELQAMALTITSNDKTHVAYLLTKMAVDTPLSSVAIFCLINMCKFHADSTLVILQNMLKVMEAIEEAVNLPKDKKPVDMSIETKQVFDKLSRYYHFDGSIYILMEHQLKQIANALPDFTEFLTSVSLIDDDGNPTDVTGRNVNNTKLHSICTELTELLHASKKSKMPDFKDKARAIITRSN